LLYLFQRHFFNDEDKGFVVVGVEVGSLHRRLLLLADPLPLRVEELDLDVGVGGAGDVHLLQPLALQDTDRQLLQGKRREI
jgi:hypothetical protein